MKKILKTLWIVLIIVFLTVFIFICSTVYNGYTMYKTSIDKISIEEKVATIQSDKNYVNIEKIPKKFTDAIIAVEDHRFRTHQGIDLISISRAVITDIQNMSLVEGGSTITQQLVKNLYFTQEKDFSRKVAEVFMAFDFENRYTKDDIIEMYCNVVYFGNGCYGIKEAAKVYLAKDVSDLTLYEITLLAGLPNAPSVYDLTNKNGLAEKRQNMVIESMAKYNYLTEDEVNSIKSNQIK